MARATRRISPSRHRDQARHEVEVLEAALGLFSTRGFGSTTIAEVAAASGFSVATLYNLFGSKEAILERILASNLDASAESIALAVDGATTPRDKLEASVMARARFCAEHRPFFALYAESYFSLPPERSDRVPPRMTRAVQAEVERLESIFREIPHGKLDAGVRALAFYGATRAFLVERILRAEKPVRPAQITALVAALLDGLA
jgi:AcrR family transcriptional regulator